MESSEVSIKTRSPPASLSFKGQATKHTTVKWSNAISSNMIGELTAVCYSNLQNCQQTVSYYQTLLIGQLHEPIISGLLR